MLLNKACQQEKNKHEKRIVVDDFKTKISLVFKRYCYNRTNVTPDDDFNIGADLKTFFMANRLCITSTSFDYPNENRYTWYRCKTMTKAVKSGLYHRNDNLRTKTNEINENTNRRQVDPIQTSFIRQLQDINNTELNTTLPDKEELRSVNHQKMVNRQKMYFWPMLNTQRSAKNLPFR